MIKIEKLNVQFKDFHLKNIDLYIKNGDFFILLGPTGSGKTLLLESIAGLVRIQSGKIIVGGKDVTKLPPEKRGISIVYQDYSLFPHLSVMKNITYGLNFHKINNDRVNERLNFLIKQLNLSNLLKRYPSNLSGGECQRVALARALIINPDVVLLDEPISALDPVFREDVKENLRMIHNKSNVTFIMVTHDFADALSLGERAAVINNGKIEQEGTIETIFRKPNTPFVADFVGAKNIFHVKYRDTKALLGNLIIETGMSHKQRMGYIAIRPEDIVISNVPFKSSMKNSFYGRVKHILNQGFFYEIHIQVDNFLFKSMITKSSLLDLKLSEGLNVYISFKATAIHNF